MPQQTNSHLELAQCQNVSKIKLKSIHHVSDVLSHHPAANHVHILMLPNACQNLSELPFRSSWITSICLSSVSNLYKGYKDMLERPTLAAWRLDPQGQNISREELPAFAPLFESSVAKDGSWAGSQHFKGAVLVKSFVEGPLLVQLVPLQRNENHVTTRHCTPQLRPCAQNSGDLASPRQSWSEGCKGRN